METLLTEPTDNRRARFKEAKIERFWEGLLKPQGCWLFDGAKEINGYGYLKNPLGDSPKFITAHRLAWILKNGPVPDGLRVLHKCDVRACCNPGHLFLGTDADNNADKRAKGRGAAGERSWSATTTDEVVLEIRRLYKKTAVNKGNGPELAKKFGLSLATVQNIVARRTWKHLP
jgi:hypothetical protein